ncbi:FtsW/RodA/SpoVE family cell cycle protein [Jatrophihabitans endophyticus]|uniref:FtsW/RodA/SpoVE family cell cycle protein n=1 Tax=Jatrophihabitans endophyticus TaxID=1206085 RepID=UPI0019E510FC|nr:FtsW/RodA/SpoVE family cell cycle protein [Jatrophihabitans endophyticus]MBE7187927.1 FtsW/RodA/SpoVE family cell cycle protein [Jatrophihabitans endophyticus]
MSTLSAGGRIPTRRNIELLMIVFAVLITVAAEAAVEGAQDGHVSTRLLTYAAVPLVAGVITHLVIRRVARYADPLMLPIVVLLNGLGLVMIHRIDLGTKQLQGASFQGAAAPTQVVWTALGVALFLAILLVVRDHRVLQRYAYTLALIGVFLLLLPAVLPAQFSEVNGARIWIRVAGFSLQPGEFAKILLTIFGAAYLVQKRDVLALAGRRVLGIDFPRGRDFGPLLLVWLFCIGILVRGHDLGTSLLFFGIFVVLLYIATERVSWVILGVLLFAGGAYVAFEIFATVRLRVDLWLHLFHFSPYYQGQQPQQALFGLGTGGIFGTGLGNGHPQLVPLANTDYIIASFGEEIGLFGLAGLLALYAVLISRGFAAGLAVRDSFGKLLAGGLAFLFALQIFIVVAGVTRLLPETGLTAPFLSYGGSSLLGSWAILGLLVRISDAARRPATTPPQKTPPTDTESMAVSS